jgi:hypothetical protein
MNSSKSFRCHGCYFSYCLHPATIPMFLHSRTRWICGRWSIRLHTAGRMRSESKSNAQRCFLDRLLTMAKVAMRSVAIVCSGSS